MRTTVTLGFLVSFVCGPVQADPVRLGASEFNHGASVDAVLLTRDGSRLVTSGGDGVLVVWDVATKRALHRLTDREEEGGLSNAKGVALSPDGKLVAAVGQGNQIHVWSTETGTLARTLSFGEAHSLDGVCFGPDGQLAATGDGQVGVWGADGAPTWLLEVPGGPHVIDWSPTGDALAVLAIYGKGISLLDPATGKVQSEIATQAPRNTLCYSPDGATLAVTQQGRVDQLDPKSGETLRSTDAHGADLLAFSPDGATLISLDANGDDVRAFDAQTLQLRWRTDVGEQVTGCSATNEHVAVACRAPQAALYELKTGSLHTAEPAHRAPVMTVAWSPDGSTLASGRDRIVLWDTARRTIRAKHPTLHGTCKALHFLPGGDLLLLEGTYSTKVRRLDAKGKERLILELREPAEAMAVSADGKRFALARHYRESTVTVHDTHTGEQTHTIETRGSDPAFSHDGSLLAFRTGFSSVRCWDLNANTETWTLERLARLSFHPKGELALGTTWALKQGTLTVLEAKTGKTLKTLEAPITSEAVCSPEGDLVALAEHEAIRIYDCETWTPRTHPIGSRAIALAWSPKGDRLACGLGDGSVAVWTRAELLGE